MLLTKKVIMKWSNNTRKYYENKGYIFTKYGDEFEVNVEDLSDGSNVFVQVKCDYIDCKNPYLNPMTWANYLSHKHDDGKYYCAKCSSKLFGGKAYQHTMLENSISFEQWLYNNLDIDYANEILSRWDTEKNGCLASEICYSSNGLNKKTMKGYWFKCLYHKEHESELKNIASFTNCAKNTGTMDCKQCNSFAQWGIDNLGEDFLEKYWSEKNKELGINPWKIAKAYNHKVWIKCQKIDYHGSYDVSCNRFVIGTRCGYCGNHKIHPKDSLGKELEDKGLLYLWSDKNGEKLPYEYSPHSGQKVWWKCHKGVHESYCRKISESSESNFRCPSCNDFSNGEKIIEEWLIDKQFKENNDDYIPQKTFDGLLGVGNGNLSYDFYLPKYNLLIEYQGEFHDGNVRHQTKKQLKKQQEHDRRKRRYAIDHKIKLLEIWYWDFQNIEQILNDYILNNKINETPEYVINASENTKSKGDKTQDKKQKTK